MPSEGFDKKKSSNREKTIVLCPECGRRTGTRISTGEVIVYCRHCKIDIEIIIRVIRRMDQQKKTKGD